MNINANAVIPLLITGGVLFALWKFGGPMGKGAALGVAGVMAVNQVPVVRDGLTARLAA